MLSMTHGQPATPTSVGKEFLLRKEYFKAGYIIENGRVELYNPYEDGYNYAW